jgi:hypothetical protein
MKPTSIPLSPLLFLLSFLLFVSTVESITLNKRTDPSNPRVLSLNLVRNSIPDPLVHDAQRRRWIEHKKKKRKRASDTNFINAVIDNEITLYAINITVGTPEQAFTVNIDTGSSDLWLNSAKSRLCRLRSQPCAHSGLYNANSSSSYAYVNSAFNISYAGGNSAAGDYATDTVRVAGRTVSDLQFGIGYQSTSPVAILGLGYPLNEAQSSNAGLSPYQNLPEKLAADSTIASNAYSIWLNDLDANTGNLLFGGVDRAQYEGDLVTVPVQTEDGVHAEFLVPLTDVQLDGQSVEDVPDSASPTSSSSSPSSSVSAIPALLDTGTTLMYLPDAMTEAIYEAVNAQFLQSQQVATVSCDLASQNINMTFRFADSVSINVPLNELVIDTQSGSDGSDGGTCQFGIAPAGRDTIILGDTFLRSAYVVFDIDNNEISLAQSKMNATDSDIVEIGSGPDAVPSAATATGGTTASETSSSAAPTSTETGSEGAGCVMVPSLMGVGVSVFLTVMLAVYM